MGTMLLCTVHHQAYDAHVFDILMGPSGADGEVGWTFNGRSLLQDNACIERS
jgi:hypothetical protein